MQHRSRVRFVACLACALALWAVGCQPEVPRTVSPGGVNADAPRATAADYEPRAGDWLFQSSPHNPLVDAIEGATHSPYSHCGLVVQEAGTWHVLEAIGPVRLVPLAQWIAQGRGGTFDAYRPMYDAASAAKVEAAARAYLGRPYDMRYRLDDERIYCSELIWKACRDALGEPPAPLIRLGDLDWHSYEQTIREIEGTDPPLDREMITPVALSRSTWVKRVE